MYCMHACVNSYSGTFSPSNKCMVLTMYYRSYLILLHSVNLHGEYTGLVFHGYMAWSPDNGINDVLPIIIRSQKVQECLL